MSTTKKTTLDLLQLLVALISETAEHCDKHQLSLTPLPAFQRHANSWQEQLLSIYRTLYQSDCDRSYKMQRLSKATLLLRGLIDSVMPVSQAARSLIEYLALRGNPELHEAFVKITEQVHETVFGPVTSQVALIQYNRRNSRENSLELVNLKPNKHHRRKRSSKPDTKFHTNHLMH